jgi:hypothetical protein
MIPDPIDLPNPAQPWRCELHYFPSVWFWALLIRPGDHLTLEDHDHHQKGSFRNRCIIDGSNGIQHLSIPLRQGKHQQMPARDVQIAHDVPWETRHWRTIVSAYGRAPFFEHYEEDLANCYLCRDRYLRDWNIRLFEWLKAAFDLPGVIDWSVTYLAESLPDETDLRGRFRPANRQTPPVGLQEAPYPQVFADRHPFIPGLSGLDLLFCAGPASRDYLRAMRRVGGPCVESEPEEAPPGRRTCVSDPQPIEIPVK